MPNQRGRGGRGGGRGGRGGGARGRRGGHHRTTGQQPKIDAETVLDITKDVRGFFVGQASFDQHYDAQETNKIRYTAGLAVMQKNGVEISQNARVRALAAAWARQDQPLANSLLSNRTDYGLVEVLKAITLLDSSRNIRVQEKKLKRLNTSSSKVKPKVIGKIKSNIDNLKAIRPKHGSASGAVIRHIKQWVRGFSQRDLEFFALHFPAEPWTKLADICHFNPKKDFPDLPWFLPYCFGQPAPDDHMVTQCKDLKAETVNDLFKEYPIPYSHLKAFKDNLTIESKANVASEETLDTVLWYYEDLQCEEVDKVIQQRLNSGETLTLNDGKLLERLLTIKMLREGISQRRSYWNQPSQRVTNPTKAPFLPDLIPLAQTRLDNMSLPLEPPIVVIGDRSASMDVAIRTSTIIASLLSAIVQAKLVFFNTENMDAEKIPKDINDVLETAVTITADGGTSPAASLYPFYEKKQVVQTFIIVTDEEENRNYQGFDFKTLYDKYYKEVFPARLVFVSFLRSQHASGQMVRALGTMDYKPLQFRLDSSRPDLSKLDNLFGLLSSNTSSFEEEVSKMETDISTNGLMQIFKQNLQLNNA